MPVNLLLISTQCWFLYPSPPPFPDPAWDYWVTVGEASEELMSISRGESRGKASEGFFLLSPSMLFTTLTCDVSSAILYLKLGREEAT